MTAPLADDKLQQYFDGELPEEEMSEVRAILDESEETQARLDALSRLHDFVNLAAETDAEDLDADAMFETISVGVKTGQSLYLIKGGEVESRKPPKAGEPWRFVAPVVAVAIAAAVLFAIIGPGQGNDDDDVAERQTEEVEEGPTVIIEEEHSEPMVHVEPPHGTEVVEVDFGDNTGTVFAVEGEVGEPIAVVWISDEEVAQ
jgi:hypothetical protein